MVEIIVLNVQMSEVSAVMKKSIDNNSVICECGCKYYASDLGTARHMTSKTHQNNMAKLVKGKKYTEKQLHQLCSLNKIEYFKRLTMKEMALQLNDLGNDLKLSKQ